MSAQQGVGGIFFCNPLENKHSKKECVEKKSFEKFIAVAFQNNQSFEKVMRLKYTV